jgi:hypothetical protein
LAGDANDDDPYGYEDDPIIEPHYPSNPQADYQSYSTGDNAASGDDEEEEDPVLIQGSIKAGKGTAIRLPELADDYYPY